MVANLLFRTNETTNSSYGSQTSGNASSSLSDPTIGSTVQKVSSGDSKVRNINGIGVVNYTLLNRYVFNGTIGVESNSAMGKSERLGIFPAAGFAWHLAEEPFINNTD